LRRTRRQGTFVADFLQITLKISLFVFTVGNLLDMGLRIDFKAASTGLRNLRFIGLVLLTDFILDPAIAYLTTRLLPVASAYAAGLMLLSLAPGAPFLPVVAERAKGDLNYAAVFTIVASLGTVVFMPLAAPLMSEGLNASAWAIARPLLLLVLLPLVIGMLTRARSPLLAERGHPVVRAVTNVATVCMLVLCIPLYGRGFMSAIGTFAIAAQAMFLFGVAIVAHLAGYALAGPQRAILTLGNVTRNVGAALAPLLEIPEFEDRTIVMVVLAVPMQIGFAWVAAALLSRRVAGQ
jgi:bile acid:Na+ symporter, BASS family